MSLEILNFFELFEVSTARSFEFLLNPSLAASRCFYLPNIALNGGTYDEFNASDIKVNISLFQRFSVNKDEILGNKKVALVLSKGTMTALIAPHVSFDRVTVRLASESGIKVKEWRA